MTAFLSLVQVTTRSALLNIMDKQKVIQMTAQDIVDLVAKHELSITSNQPPHNYIDDTERVKNTKQQQFNLMYGFIKGLHPATMMLPKPLKKK